MDPAPSDDADVTILMTAAAAGDKAAAQRLLPLVYDQLHRAAQSSLQSERTGHTLTPTALVHEAYVKLAGPREVPWTDRWHFYFAAAQAMRRILIDHARARARRGGDHLPLTELGDVAGLAAAHSEQIEAVDAAFARLESVDPEAASVVRFRLYAGLSVDQTALALGMSPRSVARLWQYARARLYRELTDSTNHHGDQ